MKIKQTEIKNLLDFSTLTTNLIQDDRKGRLKFGTATLSTPLKLRVCASSREGTCILKRLVLYFDTI